MPISISRPASTGHLRVRAWATGEPFFTPFAHYRMKATAMGRFHVIAALLIFPAVAAAQGRQPERGPEWFGVLAVGWLNDDEGSHHFSAGATEPYVGGTVGLTRFERSSVFPIQVRGPDARPARQGDQLFRRDGNEFTWGGVAGLRARAARHVQLRPEVNVLITRPSNFVVLSAGVKIGWGPRPANRAAKGRLRSTNAGLR